MTIPMQWICVRIQYGTSFGYPVSAVGSHVSAVPNHRQEERHRSIQEVSVPWQEPSAMNWDPAKMTDEERREIREQIVEYKNMHSCTKWTYLSD